MCWVSIKHPALVLQAVLFEDCFQLFPECPVSMVFSLVFNVGDGVLYTGNTNAEGSVSFLPFKRGVLWKCFVNPL